MLRKGGGAGRGNHPLGRGNHPHKLEFVRLIDAQFSDLIDDVLLVVGVQETFDMEAAEVGLFNILCLLFSSFCLL